MRISKLLLVFSLILGYGFTFCQTDAEKIKKVNADYVEHWLDGDKTGVLSLFEKDAVLSPSGMAPVKGIQAIEQFWFPDDSSITTIHKFTNEIKNLEIEKDIAYSTQKSFLSWSYRKRGTLIKKDQWGVEVTVYRKQSDQSWKIWRQLWTDLKVVDRK
jgi:ketosteroid isomerase-like protein